VFTVLVEGRADVEVSRPAMRMSGLLVVILIAFLISLAAAWWLLRPGKYAAPPPGYIGPGAPDAGPSLIR
jgi:hypothetical protein